MKDLLQSESEFHITDEDLIECCKKVEQMTKEENNIDAPEGARGDKTKKTIVDIIFEDFSTTPFNSPTASPERNLERSPLFILLEKPKRYYSRKKKMKSNLEEKFKATIDDDMMNMSTCSPSLLQYNKNLVLGESNVALGLQKASGERPELGEGQNAVGGNEIFIENELEEVKNKMHQSEVGEINNPVSSLVSADFQTASGKKISISEEGQKSIQNILREFQDNLQETDYETELKDIKARISNKSMESKFKKTANVGAQIANKTRFQAATRKRQFQDCLQEKDCETELKDVKDRMECKFKKMTKNSAHLGKTTGFQTANGNNVLISEKGRKLMESLLNEFHQSESDGDIENNLLCIKNKIISKKPGLLSEKKTLKTSLTSRKEDGDYPSSSKLPADEKKPNVKVENDKGDGEVGSDIVLSVPSQDNSKQFECKQTYFRHSALNVPMMIRKNRFLSLNPKLNRRNQQEGLSTPKTMSNNLRLTQCETPNKNLIQTETMTPELGKFFQNAVVTSTPCNRKLPLQEMENPDTASCIIRSNSLKNNWRLSGLRRTRPTSKK
uniref:Uncharacterized protein n=1 Tax=Glossina pallidipes TaxID=7398 RepID=A0A1A9ZYY8_GLOPL